MIKMVAMLLVFVAMVGCTTRDCSLQGQAAESKWRLRQDIVAFKYRDGSHEAVAKNDLMTSGKECLENHEKGLPAEPWQAEVERVVDSGSIGQFVCVEHHVDSVMDMYYFVFELENDDFKGHPLSIRGAASWYREQPQDGDANLLLTKYGAFKVNEEIFELVR